MTHTTKLDLLHKGIYPLSMMALSAISLSFGCFVYLSNTDKQKQIDSLQSQMKSLQAQQEVAEQVQQEREQRAEEEAQRMRVELWKKTLTEPMNFSNSPDELKARSYIRSHYWLIQSALERNDRERLGEDKATERWASARSQAEKELKAKTIDYTP